jgi:hypothetical protein
MLKDKTLTKSILDIWFLIAIMLSTIIFVFIVTTRLSHANEIETLLNKLVEKGVLTGAEAQQVLVETREEERKKIAQVKHDILPEWIQKTKFQGDFRLREQYEKRDATNEARWRTRFRLRFGFETKVNDKFLVGFGLASGSSDPRSTNQTFQDTFSHKGVTIDYAFAQYTPTNWLTLIGGKFKNPLFNFGSDDVVWDGDINPEGGAAKFNYKLCDQFSLFTNAGFFVIDENDPNASSFDPKTGAPVKDAMGHKNPLMWVIQPGFEWKIKDVDYKDIANLKTAVAYYGYNGVKGAVLDNTSGTNTLIKNSSPYVKTGVLKYNYSAVSPNFLLGFAPPNFLVPYLGVFGQYIYNPDPSENNKGWLAGLMFGDEKVKEKGQWQARYMYRRIETDAIPDILPDSDFFGGSTNVKGHKEVFEYGIAKNTSLSATAFQSGIIKKLTNKTTSGSGKNYNGTENENLLQLDFNLKF